MKQADIRLFLTKGERKGEDTILHASCIRNQTSFSTIEEKPQEEVIDTMKMIRNKMVEARRADDKQQSKDAILVRRQLLKTWRGERLTHARDVANDQVQDVLELVVVGADVVALYPSLTDIEIANICFEAIMKSSVKFQNINYRKARLYIATCMNKTDQRTSPLWRVLPRRTARVGVRPGVTASPTNEEHWAFPWVELTEYKKRLIVATVVKIGVLEMNTHIYSWNGEIYLQKAGFRLASAALALLRGW